MTTYYVDLFNGDDSNPGTSWGSAFKTFRPFNDMAHEGADIPLAAGDLVKVSKTADLVATGETYTAVMSGRYATQEPDARACGWSPVEDLALPAVLQPNMQVIVATGEINSFVNANCSDVLLSTPTTPCYPQYLLVKTASTAVTGAKIGHFPLAAPLDLSAFSRIEIPIYANVNYQQKINNVGEWGTIRISLCSDTAGDVEVLSIITDGRDRELCIASYDGTLPSVVNSVALYVESEGYRMFMVLGGAIATHSVSSANYCGWNTCIQIGDHEAAFPTLLGGFYESGSVNYAKITTNIVGPSSLHGEDLNVYYRTATGYGNYANWRGYLGLLPEKTSAYCAMFYFLGDEATMSFVYLRYAAGAEGNPITIEGGYNTSTDTVDGTTFVRAPIDFGDNTTNFFMREVCPVLHFHGCSYITVKNLDVAGTPGGVIRARETTTNISFENCTMVARHRQGAGTDYCMDALFQLLRTYRPVIQHWSFTNCKGTIHAVPLDQDLEDDGYYMPWVGINDCLLAPRGHYGFTYTNCAFFPYTYRRPFKNVTLSYGYTPIKVVGTLKVYAVPGPLSVRHQYAGLGHLVLPLVRESASAEVYVYRGGASVIQPAVYHDESGSVFTHPAWHLEDTIPVFISSRLQTYPAIPDSLIETNATWVGVDLGSPSLQVFPSLAINFTGLAFCADMDSATYLAYYAVNAILAGLSIANEAPPVVIQSLTVSGDVYPTAPDTVAAFFKDMWQPITVNSVSWSANIPVAFAVGMETNSTFLYNTSPAKGSYVVLRNVDFGTVDVPLVNQHLIKRFAGTLVLDNVTAHFDDSVYAIELIKEYCGDVFLEDCTLTTESGNALLTALPSAPAVNGHMAAPPIGYGRVAVNNSPAVVDETALQSSYAPGADSWYTVSVDDTLYTAAAQLVPQTVSGHLMKRTTLMRPVFTRYENRYRLAIVRVAPGRPFTVSCMLQGEVGGEVALVVLPNGTAGSMQEYSVVASTVLETKKVEYKPLVEGDVLVLVTHCGPAGHVGYFGSLRTYYS